MKKQAPFKLLAFVSVLLILMVGFIYDIKKTSDTSKDKEYITSKEKSEQEKAEEYAEKMKPKIKEKLKKEDIHHFIKDIKFNEKVTISPMGMIELTGYVNNNPEKFSFDVSLRYGTDKVDSIGYSKDLADRFENWDDFDKEVKEDFLNSLTKEEREQYLKDIGELK
ncbi:DUF1433 domain-containing protein [Bacillus halotolerans]|uniref:DUF1433 domain-containing protein n=1 Tax=Bacillus TaxID=1386 RepID=UPI00166280D5|nr:MULTISPECIES: DUF1433 domain-containing protein [Bacillus]MBV7321251.1 DUF1433 domain-containing protein [Halalkalibacterium halodurans]MCV0023656.1 DUF1433 domain-containing protein [Bacillus sp. XT-2]QNS20211.1 DUF1433 domain-containing protein [Bacillus halotolerans]